LETLSLDSVDSTHTYLKNYIKKYSYKKPIAIVTLNQINGVGSRENNWEGKNGNLFFSFVLNKSLLPMDLPIQSYSIYFSYILKLCLKDLGSATWLKWPNDFYINDKKIGGTITNLSSELVYCGIGLNLKEVSSFYGYLDIKVNIEKLLKNYFALVESKILWKQIFSKYLIEFKQSKQYKTTVGNEKVSLQDAILNDDGSICINNKKVFSLR